MCVCLWQQFECLETQMGQMESVCKDMKQRIVKAESLTADMIEQADIMQEHR